MNDKDLILKLVAEESAKIGKMIFPSIPVLAVETIVTLGLKNQMTKYGTAIDFFFDTDGNLPSPDEFWLVGKSILNDKPIIFPVFGKVIKISGDDVEEIKKKFNERKS